jgi:hypothetical protein
MAGTTKNMKKKSAGLKVPDEARFTAAVDRRPAKSWRIPGIGKSLVRKPLSKATRTFLREQAIPPELCAFFERHSYRSAIVLAGDSIFNAANELPGENSGEYDDQCMREGLLVVGSAPNGDFIVVDLKNELAVGYVAMAELYEADSARDIYAPTPFDLGTFFWLKALYEDEESLFPIDYYAAVDVRPRGWARFDPERKPPARPPAHRSRAT